MLFQKRQVIEIEKIFKKAEKIKTFLDKFNSIEYNKFNSKHIAENSDQGK